MILTREQFEARLNSPENLMNIDFQNRVSSGRESSSREDSNNNSNSETASSGANPSPRSEVGQGEVEDLSSPSPESEIIDEDTGEVKIVKWAGHSTTEREHYKLTEEQRVTIGSLGQVFQPKQVAELTGVSVDAVRDLRNGKRGSSGFDPELMKKVNDASAQKRTAVQEKAVDALLASIGLLTEEKMENLGAKDLSAVASNMSKVVSNLEPKDKEGSKGGGVNITIYAPKTMKEEHFEVVKV